MTKGKKRLIKGGIVIFVIILGILYYFYINVRYDYTHLLSNKTREEGTALQLGRKDSKVNGMALVAESDQLKLYLDEATTGIAVEDKATGSVWYALPENRESDKIANGTEQASMASMINVSYYDETRQELKYVGYKDSVEKGQYEYEMLEDGIRITYTFGDLSLGVDALPKYITPERFEEKIVSKLSDKTARDISKRYVVSKDHPGFLELLESSKKSALTVKKMLAALEEAGYTEEDLAEDNEASGYKMNITSEYCEIPVEVRLASNYLEVTVPTSEIKEVGDIKVGSIELMKYFGAADAQDEGYMLVPNGSGSLIYLNNGKTGEDSYTQNIYDTDNALYNRYRIQVTEKARLPIFGMKKKAGAVFAYISNGDALASVNADVAGRVNEYNTVYPKFTLRNTDWMSMTGVSGGEEDLTIVEKAMCQEDLQVNYYFLEKEAGYSEMAQCYRDELVNKGELKNLEEAKQMPFYLDVLGGIEKTDFIVGVPYDTVIPMTTSEEAEGIIDELDGAGIQNVQMRLQGWFNGGVYHDVAKAIDLEKKVINKKKLQNLEERLEAQGGNLFPDVAFQLVPYYSEHYIAAKEGARYIAGQTCTWAGYNRATLRMSSFYKYNWFIVNSPGVLPEHIGAFVKDYDKLGVSNLALRDLGDYLSSDKNKKYPIDRQVSELIVREQLGKVTENKEEVMLSGGNAYSLAYADHLINVPTDANAFYIVDEGIPFYEMVIHGHIDYTGQPINLIEGYDQQEALLKMIEYGNSPYFVWTHDESEILKNSPFDVYYSTCYKDWIEEAVALYDAFNKVSLPVRTSEMLTHTIVAPGVRKMTYANGTEVYVNYTDESVVVDGVRIDAKDYAVGGAK